MNAQLTSVTSPSDNRVGYFVEAAARLVEAASLVRDGYGEAAKVHVACALALLRGDRNWTPEIEPPPNRRAEEVVRGGLAAWQMRRVTAYIDAHLDGRIHIENLAGLLKLSAGHFSRAFRSLLRCAAGCTIKHISRVFRQIVGETPNAWRRTRWVEIEDRSTRPSRNSIDPPGLSIFSSHAGSKRSREGMRRNTDPACGGPGNG